jgi:hypothetical protein
MINYLGHKFVNHALPTNDITYDLRFKYYQCIDCEVIVYDFSGCIDYIRGHILNISKVNKSKNLDLGKELLYTCDEMIIKNIIE